MSLTQEQAKAKANEAIELYMQSQNLKADVRKTFIAMWVFLVIGIFFFPCLVVALICFALYHFGNKKADALLKEVYQLEAIPEVSAVLEDIAAAG